jgi:hypothetical protein
MSANKSILKSPVKITHSYRHCRFGFIILEPGIFMSAIEILRTVVAMAPVALLPS